MKTYIERRRIGRRFDYFKEGRKISSKEEVAYLNSLRIPPAWKDVRISANKRSSILATGYDKAGRLQYIYNPRFRARQEKHKFERILMFARALPRMRRITNSHLAEPGLSKQKVLACVVRLMDETYFRIGNEEYAKDNQSYGLSTLRSKHISIDGDTVTFDFMGKSGKRQFKQLTDRKVAKIIRKMDGLPGYEIFKYYDERGNLTKLSSKDVNAYIKEIMGEEFSAKDFRTWGGTLLATAELAAAERADSERERKKIVTGCVKKVAAKLGNTPAIARASYIDPRVISSFLETDDLKKIKETVRQESRTAYLNSEERCVLALLEKAV